MIPPGLSGEEEMKVSFVWSTKPCLRGVEDHESRARKECVQKLDSAISQNLNGSSKPKVTIVKGRLGSACYEQPSSQADTCLDETPTRTSLFVVIGQKVYTTAKALASE